MILLAGMTDPAVQGNHELTFIFITVLIIVLWSECGMPGCPWGWDERTKTVYRK